MAGGAVDGGGLDEKMGGSPRVHLPVDGRRDDEQVQLSTMDRQSRGEGRDRADAAAQPTAYGYLSTTQQRRRSVRGPEACGAFGRPADDADLRARTGGGPQESGGGAEPDMYHQAHLNYSLQSIFFPCIQYSQFTTIDM